MQTQIVQVLGSGLSSWDADVYGYTPYLPCMEGVPNFITTQSSLCRLWFATFHTLRVALDSYCDERTIALFCGDVMSTIAA